MQLIGKNTCIFFALLFALTAKPDLSWGDTGDAQVLLLQYQQIKEKLLKSPFNAPLYMQSEDGEKWLNAEVYGIIERPFETLTRSLAVPSNWCKFVPLSLNIKYCTYQTRGGQSLLTFYIGHKYFQSPTSALELIYQYQLKHIDDSYFHVLLSADKGLLGSRFYSIRLEAIPLNNSIFVRFKISYQPSLVTRLATAAYLATLGRHKVGFSVSSHDEKGRVVYVQGVKGIIERNIMRYYLALRAFVDTMELPVEERFKARLEYWFHGTEIYQKQLFEMERGEYLRIKHHEHEQQLKLQEQLTGHDNTVSRF